MAKAHKLAPFALIPFLVCIATAQEGVKVRARVPNYPRIARAWNLFNPLTAEFNAAMQQANALLKERFNNKVLLANPDEKRRAAVVHYKIAKEALLKELDALNELIEEEDY